MGERNTSVRYNEAATSFIGLARTLSDDDWATPVPCTPGWTVRDVLSHVAGVPDDGLNGRVDGAATEPWTASQVERNAHFTVDELLTRWESQYELFGAAVNDMGEDRPPYDCHTHEHDVRHALARPANRESSIIDDAAVALLGSLSEVPVIITVDFGDGTSRVTGRPGSEAGVGLSISKFELFRSRLGRRTAQQARSMAWSGPSAAIDAVLAKWFVFGPSQIEIIE